MSELQGSCLCGAVGFRVAVPLRWMTHCHCGICRKAHGAPFATFVGGPLEGFAWTRGRERVVAYESSPGNGRPFCGVCGSRVPSPWQGEIAMPVGVLQGDPGVRASVHMFAASRAPWWEIAGDLPRVPGSPSGGPELANARATEPAPGKLRGACLCGEVAYEVDAPLAGEIWCCHCTRCQRAHAAAHAANAFLPSERFRWLRGEAHIRSYKIPEALRFTQFFCARCGGSLPKARPDRPYAVIPVGTLEDDPGIRPGRHIFVSSRAAWDEIADALPQFSENAPDHPFASSAPTR